MFNNLTSQGLEETEDRLGGFQVLESDAYLGTIKAAYGGKSSGGAMSVTILLDLPNGREYSETFYVTNKAGENFFRNKQDNTKKVPLPGFTMVDDLCLVTTNKPLSEQPTEDKVMNVYDPEQKKQMPKSVPMLVDLLGQQATFGIVKQVVNKNEKNSVGEYVPTDDTREENVTEKVFHYPSNMTVVEARQGAQEASFFNAWVQKNKDQTRDRRAKKDGQGGKPGAPPQAGNQTKPTTSLFGKN